MQELIYNLNKIYPKSLTINALSTRLNRSANQVHQLIQSAIDLGLPVYHDHSTVKLMRPLYSKSGITEKLTDNKFEMHFFDRIDSTNRVAKDASGHAKQDAVFIAYEQTAGVGRLKRSWQSPVAKSLSLSILYPNFPKDLPTQLMSQLAGAGLYLALRQYSEDIWIKWPNDIIINHKKVAGILSELEIDSQGRHHIILGMGINLLQRQADFPPDIQDKASSLLIELDTLPNLDSFIANLIEIVDHLFNLYKKTENPNVFLSICRDRSILIGSQVLVYEKNGAAKPAKVIDINQDGSLQIIDSASHTVQHLNSGQVSIRKQDGQYI